MGEGEDEKEARTNKQDDSTSDHSEAASNIFQGDGGDTISDMKENDADEDDESEEDDAEDDLESADISEHDIEAEYDEGDDCNEDEEDVEDGEVWAEGQIPVIVTNRDGANRNRSERERRELRGINSNDRVAESAEFPTIAVTNFRSLWPRVQNVKDDILLRSIDVQICSETWEKEDDSRLKTVMEELFELHGLQYISCPRPNKKRGGGAGIIVNTRRFSITKLNILVPSKLEVVWGLLRSNSSTKNAVFNEYIICALYSPPNYKKNNALQAHVIGTMHHLLTMHPKAAYCIAGDKNSLQISPIIAALPHCQQAVTLNTYKQKILDVILWNMGSYYNIPYIAPAVQADRATHVPSDHNNAVDCPLAGAGAGAKSRQYSVKTSRPLPESGIRQYGQWLATVDWVAVLGSAINTEDQDATLRATLGKKTRRNISPKEM